MYNFREPPAQADVKAAVEGVEGAALAVVSGGKSVMIHHITEGKNRQINTKLMNCLMFWHPIIILYIWICLPGGGRLVGGGRGVEEWLEEDKDVQK